MKRAVVLGLSGVLLLAGAVVVLPTFIDWNRYRSNISSALEDATGREISVGALNFHLLPQPTLRAAGVTIANAEGGEGPYFAQVGALDVRVAFLPLLSGTVKIESVGLIEPQVYLEVLPDGRGNWSLGEEGEEDGGSADIRIDRLTVESGAVSYRGADGQSYQLDGIEADVSAGSLDGPFEGTARLRQAGVPMQLTFATGRRVAGAPMVLNLGLSLPEAGAEAGFMGTLTQGDSLAAQGTVTIEGGDLAALLRQIRQFQGGEAISAPAVPYTLGTSVTLEGDTLALDNLSVALNGEEAEGSALLSMTDIPSFDFTLSASRFNLDTVLANMSETPETSDEGTFSLPQGVVASVDLRANALDYRGGILRQFQTSATLSEGELRIEQASVLLPGAADASFTGSVTAVDDAPAFDGNLAANAGNLRALLSWAGADVSNIPEGRLAQMDVKSAIEWRGDTIRFTDLGLGIDGTRARGALAITMGEVPDVAARLSLDRLDLAPYLPASEEEGSGIDLSPLKAITGDFDIEIARLIQNGVVANDVALTAGLQEDRITLTRFTVGRVADGTFEAGGTISGLSPAPKADLRLKAEGTNLARFAEAFMAESAADLPTSAFSLDGALTGTMQQAAFDGTGRLGDTALTLKTSLSRPGDNLAGNGSFTVEDQSLGNLLRQFGVVDLGPTADDMPVALSGTLEGNMSQGELAVTGRLAGGSLDLGLRYGETAKGRTFRLNFTALQPDPVPLMQAFGMDYEPMGPLSPATVTINLNSEPEMARLDSVLMQLGDMRIEGTGTIDRSGPRPMISGQVSGNMLVLDRLLPPFETGIDKVQASASQSAAAKARMRWSREPMDVAFIRENDANIRVTAESIAYGPYRLQSPNLSIIAKDGVLEVSPLSAGLFGGTATIRATLNANGTPRLTASADMADVDAAQLQMATMGNALATGRMELESQFTASGESQAQMISTLAGQADFAARNGVLRRIDLPRFSERLNAMQNIGDFVGIAANTLSGGQTAYRHLSGTLVFDEGVGTTRNVSSDIDSAAADLTATIDLPNWTLNARGAFTLTDVEGAPPVTVTLTGPIDSPTREMGTKALQNYFVSRLGAVLLRNAIGNREGGLGELLGNPQPQQGETAPGETPQSQPEEEQTLRPFDLLLDQLRKRQ